MNRITTAGITYDAGGQTLTDAIFRGLPYQYNPESRLTWSANLDGSNPSTLLAAFIAFGILIIELQSARTTNGN